MAPLVQPGWNVERLLPLRGGETGAAVGGWHAITSRSAGERRSGVLEFAPKPPAGRLPMQQSFDDPQRNWVRQRARVGLMLGPGSLLLAVFLTVLLVGVFVDKPSGGQGGAALSVALMLSAVVHLGSLLELAATAKFLRRPASPLALRLLAGYWCLLVVVVIVASIVS